MNSTRKLGRITIQTGKGLHLAENEAPLTSTTVFSPAEIGKALRLRRRELGYSQETAATLCMHSPRAIGEIERGKGSASIAIVLDYAAILDVDMSLTVRGREKA